MNFDSKNVMSYAINAIDSLTRTVMKEKYGDDCKTMFWENTYIKHQIDNRENGKQFTTEQHIKAMVYSMLSNGGRWSKFMEYFDIDTGEITAVDKIFHGYNPDYILSCNPDDLANNIMGFALGNKSVGAQMRALVFDNVPKLLKFEKEYGSIDNYYNTFVEKDTSLKSLVSNLADGKSEDKMTQMAVSLVAEYLRNVGYDIANPNSYIKKVLGCNGLEFTDSEEVQNYDVFDIISETAKLIGKRPAEVDYILWLACSENFI